VTTPTLVEMVTVELAVPFAAGVNGFCENEQVASPGSDEQPSVTGDVNPSTDATVIVAIMVPGELTVADAGEAEIVKSGCEATPVPESATV
jgi:hypothetical protein